MLAAVSLAVMPFLSLAQRRAGRELGSLSAVADSRQTLLCTYLSGVLLLGLVLNSALGWSGRGARHCGGGPQGGAGRLERRGLLHARLHGFRVLAAARDRGRSACPVAEALGMPGR
ncbi:hypothetical protein QFZ79_001376 [Arthrobacter sp. V4I6]|nr:hypothetical protein [Arthrobacter sp. V1I7]MDQ0853265.1 hypothetical protein [Arthrobacter sp. V4I6]